MTKNYCIIFLLASFLLAACQQGEDVVPEPPEQRAISFHSVFEAGANGMQAGTRAETKPLYDFVNDFVVYGINGNLESGAFTKKDLVFDNYVVWYQSNSAETTETDTHDWEYVSQAGAPYTTEGGKTTDRQRIKYWDYSQNCHYFWALSNADRGEFGSSNLAADGRVEKFTLHLSDENLSETMALYYSEICRVDLLDYGQVVTFLFRPYLSKVRVGFYETIPGFVVNNLQVKAADGSLVNDILLSSEFAQDGTFVREGTCQLSYQYTPTHKVTTQITPTQTSATMNVGKVQYQTLTARASGEEDYLPNSYTDGKTYLARSSDTPSYTLGGGADKDFFSYVLPYENRDKPITLTCNYDVTSMLSGTTTTIEDISVTVPAEYVKWQPGYEYTYIFKISAEGLLYLYDVRIDPWHYGGSQTEEWRNW